MNFKNSTSVVLLCLCSIFTHFNSISQYTTMVKGQKKVFRVNLQTDSRFIKGYVYNVSDSAVTISSNLIIYNDSVLTDADWFKTSDYNTIKTITVIRKGSVLRGTLVGAATGAIIGLATYKRSASFFGPEVSAF